MVVDLSRDPFGGFLCGGGYAVVVILFCGLFLLLFPWCCGCGETWWW